MAKQQCNYNDQVNRLYLILELLPRYPREITIGKLHQKLREEQGIDASIRTLQRDLRSLAQIYIGIEKRKNPDKSVSWYWSEGAPVINISGLTVNQALALSLAENYLTPLFPISTLQCLEPFFEQSRATLTGLENNPLAKWLDKIAVVLPTQPLLPPTITDEVNKTISYALLEDKQLSIAYRRSDGVEQVYSLNPLGLVVRGRIQYLVATKVDHQELRIFALHRMKSAIKLEQPATRPNNFILKHFIDKGFLGFKLNDINEIQPILFEAIFNSDIIKHLFETPLSSDQVIKEIDADIFLLTATIQETEQLYWWLLGFANQVEVLKPLSLRNKLITAITAAAKRYAESEY